MAQSNYNLNREDLLQYKLAQQALGKLPRTSSLADADRLYKNQVYIKKYGIDDFESKSAEERDFTWKRDSNLEEAERRYSPYEARHAYSVNPIQEVWKSAQAGHPIPREKDLGMVMDWHADKGVGDPKLWEQIKQMGTYDPDGLEELLNSDWKTPVEMQKELENRRRLIQQNKTNLQNTPASSSGEAIGNMFASWGMGLGADIADDVIKEKNNKIYKDILGKSLARRDDQTLPIQKELTANILSEANGNNKKIEDAWQTLIKEHIPAFAAQYNADGTLAEGNDIENLSLQEKAELLAKAQVLFQTMDYEDARERLNNIATSYIRDHQSWWERTGMHARDFSIRAGSYAAAHVTGVGQLIADARGSSEVWVDNKGNIIDPRDVTGVNNTETAGYKQNADGSNTPVRKITMSIKDLYYQGKDDKGRDLPFIINNKTWNDAERFNIYPWQEDKIKRARDLGYSTQQILYNPGEEDSFGSFLLEAGKMGSFMLVDGIIGTATGGVGNIGAKTARVLSVGRGILSANAIGHQYGTGVYAETYEGNMAKLEEQALAQAKTNAEETFNSIRQNNPEFEAQYQKALKVKTAELKSRDPKKKAVTRDGKTTFVNTHDDSYYEALAARELLDGWVSQNIEPELEKVKNSDGYFRGIEEAHESAASAAAVTAITDAAKYSLVNTMGWRKFLFTTKAQRTAEHTKEILDKIQKTGNNAGKVTRRFEGRAPWKTAEGRKWLGKKALSNFWGGAWTNFTDEMQAAGGRQINEDRFNAYLNGDYDAEGNLIGYNGFLSYLNGANLALDKYSTWKAGAVGGAGAFLFTPNMAGILNATMTRNGRAQLRDAYRNSGVDEWGNPKSRDWGRLMDMFFSNSILNEYQGIRAGERQVQQHINMINKMVTDNDDFKALYDSLSLDAADRDATNPEDKETIQFLKAINQMRNVKKYAFKNPETKEDASDVDIVAHEIETARRAIDVIDKISKGEFSNEDAQSFLSEWYAKNPSIVQSEENDRAALQEIVKNAQTLKEALETVNDAEDKLNRIEKERGEPISENVKSRLVERYATAHILDRQDLARESRIQGREVTENTSTRDDAPIESWGTIEAIKTEVKALENTEKELDKNIAEATKVRDKAKSDVDKFTEEHKEELQKLGQGKVDADAFLLMPQLAEIQSKLESAEHQLEYLKQAKTKNQNKVLNLNNRTNVLEAQRNSGQSERVLSKEEILHLNPEARARMMARHNRDNYSKAQQEEIEALEKELTKRDPSLLKDIEVQARVAQHRRANENAYNMMVLHPDAAAAQMEAEIIANAKNTLESINLRNALGAANVLDKWKVAFSQDEVKSRLFNQLKEAPIGFLRYLNNLDGTEEGLEGFAEYKDDIKRALDWAEFSKSIDAAAKQMEFADNAERDYFIRSVGNIIENTTSKEEAQKALENAVNAEGVNDSDRTKLQALLKNIGVEVQLKQATTTETKEQKNNREQQQQQQVQQQEHQVKAAEEKGKVEAEENKQKAEEPSPGTETKSFDEIMQYPIEERATALWDIIPKDVRSRIGMAASPELIKNKYRQFIELRDKAIEGNFTAEDYERVNDALNTIFGALNTLADAAFGTGVNMEATRLNEATIRGLASSIARRIDAQSLHNQFINNIRSRRTSIEVARGKDDSNYVYVDGNVDWIITANNISKSAQDSSSENGVTNTDATINAELKQIADQQGTSVDNLEELPAQSLEDQVAKANSSGEVVAEVADTKPDLTDSGNKIEATPENLLGNTMYGYDLDALVYERVEQERTGKDSSDSMSQYFNWLKNAGVKLQEIIDNELNDIVKANPELKIVYINPQKNATNDAALGNYAMLAVKYTDAVDKVHKKERGGVIDTNDGKYLLVGTLGSNPRNKAQSTHFYNILNAGKARRDSFFATNTNERFFVDPTMYTEVEKIAAGRLVGQSIGESEVTVKRISELLADRVRNPRNLKLQDLKWVIQYATKLATVNVTGRNKVHPPKDAPSNLGNTFLLIEGANGEYVPAYIIPTFLSEIADGKLKTEINSLVDKLASPDHGERLMALYGLFHWLNLGTDKNILIGTADNPIVSFKEGDITTRTFNLADPTFNIENLRAAMMELNPRINLTIANLMDKVNLEMLDEAGALTLDLSKLATSNASYSVYAIDTDGKPIKTTPVTTNQSTDINVNSDLATSANKVENSQLFAGQVYRRRGTGWVDRAGKPITDIRLLEQLELNNYLEKNQVGVALKEGNNEYYIINSDPSNPEVWSKNSKSSFVNKLSNDASRSILDRVRATELQKEREAAAKSINDSQEVIPDNVALSESMDEGVYVLTEEDLISQTIGEPVQETSSVPTKSAPETSVDTVVGNTNGATAAYSGKTLAEMQQSTHLTTAEELINSKEFGDRVLDILDEKGFVGETTDDVNRFLEEKNMPITGITDVESWLQMLKDCR